MPAHSHNCKLPGILTYENGYINCDVKVEIEKQMKKEKAVSEALVDFGLYDKAEKLDDQFTTYTSFISLVLLTSFVTIVVLLVLTGTVFSKG